MKQKLIDGSNGKALLEKDTNKKIIGWKTVTFIEYGKGVNGDQYETGENYEPIYEEVSNAEARDEDDEKIK